MDDRLFYTGIGSRETPEAVQQVLTTLCEYLAQRDFVLRSGAAQGADTACERGCHLASGAKEIYIPWNGFSNRTFNEENVFVGAEEEASEIAKQFHPAWDRLTPGGRLLMARNSHQVLGQDLRTPSKFILCWTPGGKGGGGTGQALRIARANNIPIFDLGAEDAIDRMEQFSIDAEANSGM